MDAFYRNYGGSAGRGDYGLALSAKEMIEDTRLRILKLLKCPGKQVVFEPTATIALNIVIQGFVKRGIKNIYVSPFEHNAVTRVLHNFQNEGRVKVCELAVSGELTFDLDRIKYQFEESKPELVIVNHASNVIGLVAPVEEIFTVAKEYGAYTLVDMAQSAGVVDCNIGLNIFDVAVFAGHKTLLGPTGISGFVMKPEIDIPPILFGGTGVDSANLNMPESIPERYEMGTLNVVSIAGLNAALRWVEDKTIKFLENEECVKRNNLISVLEKYSFLKIVGSKKNQRYVGIVSCLMDGIASDVAGNIFANRGIAVRSGLHCAPSAHKFLGTFPAGTIRFSVNSLTNEIDFNELDDVLAMIGAEL